MNLPIVEFVATCKLGFKINLAMCHSESRGGSYMRYMQVFIELATEVLLAYFLILAFSPVTV